MAVVFDQRSVLDAIPPERAVTCTREAFHLDGRAAGVEIAL